MPIEMPKGLPFSVDTWSQSSKRKRHHFLTHAHKDHSAGISTHFSYPIYSTRLTKTLLLQYHPQLDESLFVGIEVGQSVVLDDPDGSFTVTALDANHCPGAIMFLFEGNFGNILHTGDCRLTTECLQCLPDKYICKKGQSCQLDYVFLDCTFGNFSQKLPSKHSAIRQVINCIWKHPNAVEVYLACDLLGQEEILADVSQTFGSKIYVDRATNPECFYALTIIAPEILSQDPSLRFKLLDGFPRLYERAKQKVAEAQVNLRPEPLIIRPSAQWYACEGGCPDNEGKRKLKYNEAVKDQFGVWHVCYSMHSSRDELEWALQLLAPKWVVSTTPNCRAMELYYVKKHCFISQISSNDPVWKLLDISVETSLTADVSTEGVDSAVSEEPAQSPVESEPQLIKVSTSPKELVSFSPPRKRLSVTLFGKARLDFKELGNQQEEKKIIYIKDEPWQEAEERVEEKFSGQGKEKFELSWNKNVKDKVEEDVNELQCEKPREEKPDAPIGSSKSLDEKLRNFYRSMNVSVPQPLPSLVQLMNSRKRGKRRFEF